MRDDQQEGAYPPRDIPLFFLFPSKGPVAGAPVLGGSAGALVLGADDRGGGGEGTSEVTGVK